MSKKLRAALIKQDVYGDLYFAKKGDKQPYLNGLKRSGPLGLFVAFDIDFFIVSKDETSKFWEEKITCCNHGTFQSMEELRNKKNKLGTNKWSSQKELSVPLKEIDFDDYDVVIALDACIPQDIIQKFSRPLWAYYVSEPCMTSYKSSVKQCLEGYEVFLNQMFRDDSNPRAILSRDSHQIDFPYCFSKYGVVHELFNIELNKVSSRHERLKVVIPAYVRRLLSQSQLSELNTKYEIIQPRGTLKQFLSKLCEGDIYLRLGNQAKFGNETTEAVVAGNLFLSTKKGFKNYVYNVEGTQISGDEFDDKQYLNALEMLEYYDNNRDKLQLNQERQRQIANYLCYERPLSILNHKIIKKQNGISKD